MPGTEAVSWESWSRRGTWCRVCLSEQPPPLCIWTVTPCHSEASNMRFFCMHLLRTWIKKEKQHSGFACLQYFCQCLRHHGLFNWLLSTDVTMKACEEGNQRSFIPRAHCPYSLLSGTDMNEGDCQNWQIQGMKQAQRKGTEFTSECLCFTPPFCLAPLIALEQQGRVQVKLSLKSDHYQLCQLAGEGTAWAPAAPWQGCALSCHTHGCSGVPGVTLHSQNLLQALWARAKAQQARGSPLRLGTCSFRHADTSGEVFCALLMAGNNASDATALNCVWGCSRFWHSWQGTASDPASILWCSQWNSPDNSWSMSYSPALPVMAKHGTWCCWPGLTGSHTSTDFPKLLLGWTLLSFTQQGWLVHTPSNKGLQINSKTQ